MLLRADEPVQLGSTFKYLGRQYERTARGFVRRAGKGYIDQTILLAGFGNLKDAPTPGLDEKEPERDEEL